MSRTGVTRRSRLGVATAAASLVLTAAVGGWAAHEVLAPPADALDTAPHVLVDARSGSVERSLTLNTAAEWTASQTLSNQATGTVTELLDDPGETKSVGEVLYTVDLRPVVVAEGGVPAFRDMGRGTEGEDVAQLQRMLIDLGHYGGPDNGVFGAATDAAVRSWQSQAKVSVDGAVRHGDVVFSPTLPARFVLDTDVAVGAMFTGGEPVVKLLPDAPSFSITMTEAQARMVEHGMTVVIDHPSGSWTARVDDVVAADEGTDFVAVLDGVDEAPICEESCGDIPTDEPLLLSSVIEIVPTTEGVVVPTAAIVTDAEGATGVVTETQTFQPVTVVASADGMSVVSGIEAGQRVQVPGEYEAR